ncbi:MAG: glycosyltransferase [Planctomycetota bacterium]
MKVDLAITGLFVGGAEKNLVRLACGLADDHGDEVRVLSLQPFPTQSGRTLLLDRLRSSGIDVSSANLAGLRNFLQSRRLIRDWCSLRRTDVCQTFLHHANWIVPSFSIAAGAQVSVGGMRVAEDRWMRNWLEGRSLRECDAVVAVSSAVAQFTNEYLSIPSSRIETIHNSIELPEAIGQESGQPAEKSWDPKSIGWPPDSIISLFVGRMHPQKAIDDLLKAVESRLPRKEQRLLLVGEGPLEGEVDRQIAMLNDRWQQNLIHRLPWQSDVMSIMKSCDMVVLPSRYEGMPNVIMEAMSLGLAVLSSDVEGSLELLGNDTEQVFPVGDVDALSNKWNAILEDSGLRQRLGRRNRQTVANNFTVPRMVSSYRSLYQRLLGRADH